MVGVRQVQMVGVRQVQMVGVRQVHLVEVRQVHLEGADLLLEHLLAIRQRSL
jgi:hypothetical protein